MHTECTVFSHESIKQGVIVRHIKRIHHAVADLLGPCVKRLKRNAHLMTPKHVIVQAMSTPILHLFHNTRDINDSTHTGHAIL